MRGVFPILLAVVSGFSTAMSAETGTDNTDNARAPRSEADLRYWLEVMAVYHRFEPSEMATATGLPQQEVLAALRRMRLDDAPLPPPRDGDRLRVLPYPGGRHPRIGFLEGAIRPQRETKCSVFAPWPEGGYAVVDLPEAIWVDGPGEPRLLYLAHTHIPTMWTERGVELEQLEWRRGEGGSLVIERSLPNGVRFGARVQPGSDGVRMELWIANPTAQTLTGLRVQNCVMLKGLRGFSQQTNDNKRFASPLVACHDASGNRWIITGWQQCQRPWANAPCPCMHADPQFADCPPGETRRLNGWVSFYEGAAIDNELQRLRTLLGWQGS